MSGPRDELPAGPALLRVSGVVMSRYGEEAARLGLTVQQARLLFVLHREPSNMLGLGQTLRLPKSTMTGVIERMRVAGLLERRPDPADRRNLVVSLTAEGRTRAEQVESALRDAIEELLDGLPDADRQALSRVLTRVAARSEELVDPERVGVLPSE